MTQVIIDDIIPRTQLTASAGQTVFNTNWTADVASDIDVYARASGVEPDDATQLVSPSNYNVTFIGASETVRVTFLSGRTLDDIITIVRNTPSTRMNLYINTNFVPSMLNQDFGILTLVDQQSQMYDTVVNPGYNVSAIIANKDKILPILEANQIWAMNNANDEIIAYDVPASGGLAPKLATYLVQTATSELPNAQSMGALASGIVVNTATTGVQLTRILTGTANQITLSNGSGIAGNPTFSITPNPTIPGTEYILLPSGTTAQRPGSPTDGMVRYNTDLSALEVYEGSAWDTLSGGLVDTITGTTNEIDINNTDPANPIVLLADNPVIPGLAGITLPSGTTAQRGGALGTIRFNSQTSEFEGTTDGIAWNTFQTSAGTILSVSGTADRITVTAGVNPVVDIASTYVGQTSITTLGTIATGVWEATDVAIAHGGTGVSSVTTAPTASAWTGWDANSNLSANNFLPNFATTASAAGTTVLTVASAYVQEITGVTTQTIEMPVASTLTVGHSFRIMNNSSGNVTINSSGGNAILVMAANTTAFITCILASGTTAASWNASYVFDNGAGVLSITGTANQVNASASTGAVTLSLPQSIATTSDVTFGSVAFSPNTKGIVGTPTNDSAGTGYVGEYVSSNIPLASAVAIASNTATNLTSISLTAGDWLVGGNIRIVNTGQNLTRTIVWISTTSATTPNVSNVNEHDNNIGAFLTGGGTCPEQRISISGTTTVYVSGFTTFAAGTASMCGNIWARRLR